MAEQHESAGANPAVAGYEDLVELARSERALVLRAWQPTFQRHVAIKLILAASPEQVLEDAQRAGALAGHPNVVAVHELGLTGDGVPFVAMELVEDGSLATRLSASGPLAWPDAAHITITLAGVVLTAGESGIDDLSVTADRVLLSRFGEPKVSIIGSVSPSAPPGVASLQELFRAMLPSAATPHQEVPASVRAVADVSGIDAAALAAQLQAAQAGAGQPVTEVPLRREAGPAPAPVLGTEVLSNAVTVAPRLQTVPPARRSAARTPSVVGFALLVAVAAVALVSRPDGETVATTRTSSPLAADTTSPSLIRRPVDPPIYVADFAPGRGWQYEARQGWDSTHANGEYRLHVDPKVGTTHHPWKSTNDESRLSLLIRARMVTGPTGRVGLVCGRAGVGSKYLAADLAIDGSWAIVANGTQVAQGSTSVGSGRLEQDFVLRLDCTTDRTPTLATLYLDDVLIGESVGLDAFPMRDAGFRAVATASDLPIDLTLTAMEIRRLA